MRKELEDLSNKWIVDIEGNNLDIINPTIRHVLREMLKLIDQALPKEVEPD